MHSQKRRVIVAAAFTLLLLNSAYLTAYATPSLFYFVNLVVHVGLGAVLAVIGAWMLRRVRVTSVLLVAVPLLAVGAATGFYLTVVGALTRNRWLVQTHVASAAFGAFVLIVWLMQRASRSPERAVRRAAMATAVVLLATIGWAFVEAQRYDRGRRDTYRIVNPHNPPLRMEGEGAGPSSPFFPSAANTNVNGIIPAEFFQTSEMCGRCHRDIYEQWNSSAHHFSSFNNQWYRKSIEYMQDVTGTTPSKWCAGCHDHAVFFNGRFDRPIKEQIDTPEAQAGLACTSCHSIVHVGSTMGQGDFTVEYPALHDLAASDNRWLQRGHDALMYMAPAPHRSTFLKPFHTEQ